MVETKTSSNEILSSEQKRNGFHTKYLSICKAKNVAPLPEVKIKQKNFHVLDFHADRVKVTDWMAICEALHNDMTLKFIAIRLRRNNEKSELAHFSDLIFHFHELYTWSVLESKDTSKKAKAVDTHPVVYTNFVLTHLIEALENVLTKNSLLETLVVEGLPLMGRYLATFVKGLVQNKSLTSINFSRSKIGDEGCTSLCNTIKHSMNIKCVNFSSCNLSAKGAEAIADLIKFQKIQRFSEAWAQSLRYREADPDSFSGVRKISLNNNPQVGHVGLETITEILQEDVWIKDVEMQNCGLTDDSAQSIISCLNLNKTILNFNIAGNSDISEHFYRHIFMSLGNSESENSDSTDSNGSSAKKVTKKDLMKNVKFLEEQLEVSIIAKKKTETLAEMLQKQFNEVQRDALIQGAFKIPEGFHLISHESLDDLMKRCVPGNDRV